MVESIIRDLPEDVLTSLEKLATLQGISLDEFVRYILVRDAGFDDEPGAKRKWAELLTLLPDLGDVEVMKNA